MPTIAGELARRIVNTAFEALTPRALQYAKMGLLDTLGVGIAGSHEDAAVIARRIGGGAAGPALVWGTERRVEPLAAAFVNGVAANVLDFDDCTDNLGGHPSSPVLPALIALGEARRSSGREILTAYVAGFEAETQLGRGVNFHHYEKGWHPTATLGVFGAGAACARLLGLDEQRTIHALALCASMAAGLKSNLGSMGKPLHVGQSARSGLLAAMLASEGYTGNSDALEHPQGFLDVFNGPGTYSVERILEKWGTPWDIELPGIYIKQYPCCLSTQSAVDLMLELVVRHDLRPDQVMAIETHTSARRLEHTHRPRPRSALDAKLSIQYVLACALVDRGVSLRHFEGDAYRAPALRHAMQLVDARPFAEGEAPDAGARISIVLADGRRISGAIDRPVGHGPGEPLAPDRLAAKFAACAGRDLAPQRIEAVSAAIAGLEHIPDLRELTALLDAGCAVAPFVAAG